MKTNTMSFIDNNDNNDSHLSPFLIDNQSIEIPVDVNHDPKNGLSFNQFFDHLMANVSNNKDKCDVWNNVLLDIIDNNVINESMLSEVLTITVDNSRSESIPNRVFSCKMLSKLSRRLNEMQYLCHDFQPSIRAHISKQMFVLSQNFSLETIKTQILPQLIELTNDSELMVRIASLESLIDLIPKFDDDFNKQIILPQIISLFDFAFITNDGSLGLIFMNFGKLCSILPKNVISREKWFLDYYCNIFLISNDFQLNAKIANYAERDIQCRILLAHYFPIMLQIYGTNDMLFSILNFLCSDVDTNVVRTIASAFNDISILMKNPFKLYPQLSKLMSQTNMIVIKELNPFLSSLLIDAIKSTPNENKNDLFVDLMQNLIGCENTICLNLDWRLQIDFYENLIQVLVYFPVKAIEAVFLPLLLNRILTARPIPLRIGTSRCVLILFKNIPVLFDVFKQKSSQNPLLSLRTDKVPNIRLNVCKCLKAFKHIFRNAKISVRNEQMKGMFKDMLSSESDRDVIEAITELIHDLDKNSEMNREQEENMKELTEEFVHLTIDSSLNTCKTLVQLNNYSVNGKALNSAKMNSIKSKSSLPQLIRSQCNSNSNTKCLSQNHITSGLYSIPSKIPKPITKSDSTSDVEGMRRLAIHLECCSKTASFSTNIAFTRSTSDVEGMRRLAIHLECCSKTASFSTIIGTPISPRSGVESSRDAYQ
ncbi:unnamed protein product [Medioppia subpectinata]|uniref:Uncharacterized protein n=1 Tax=Medioppia subpectinata TaxID=1979941 RepID=A0A7R9KXV4_9ACAR|nr:unnamed protein product [Medioppia subpectinata]CAG2111522.1 unnamed protein product [Medioppia subpectinata]